MDLDRVRAAVAIARTNADNDNYQCGVSIAEVEGMIGAIESLHRAVTDCSDALEIVKAERTEAKVEADKYYQLWQSVIRRHEDKTVPERDRLLVLATKHCHKTHHDWQEILRIAGDA